MEDLFGRVMAHAFADEMEKIALSKDALRQAMTSWKNGVGGNRFLRAADKLGARAKALREQSTYLGMPVSGFGRRL